MPAQRGVSWNALDRFVAFLELSLDWVAQFLTRVSSAGLTLSPYVIDRYNRFSPLNAPPAAATTTREGDDARRQRAAGLAHRVW